MTEGRADDADLDDVPMEMKLGLLVVAGEVTIKALKRESPKK